MSNTSINNNNCDQPGEAVDFETVFENELDAIQHRRASQHSNRNSNTAAIKKAEPWSMNLVGLAFSGGGIRSATFNLGIIQALAQLKLLGYIDYLSTVSGGGYIGSWLSAQFYRELEKNKTLDDEDDKDNKKSPVATVVEKIEKNLSPENKDISYQISSSQSPEPRVIRFLRQHSNYLTPKAGLFSADTWSILVTYLRNGLLNLIILTCLIAALLMVPRLLAAWGSIMTDANIKLFSLISAGFGLCAAYILGYSLGWYHQDKIASQTAIESKNQDRSLWIIFIIALVFLANLASLIYLRNQQPGWLTDVLKISLIATSFLTMYVICGVSAYKEKSINGDGQGAVIAKVVLPIIFVAYTSSFALPILLNQLDHSRMLFKWMTGTAVAHVFVWFAAYAGACASFFSRQPNLITQNLSDSDQAQIIAKQRFIHTWKLIITCGFFSGFIMGPLLLVFTEINNNFDKSHLLIKFGPPLYVLWLFLLSVIHTGLIGRGLSSGEREWLNRLGAWLLIFSIAWVLFNGFSFFSPLLLDWLSTHHYLKTSLASGWLLTTIAGLIASRETRGENNMGWIRKFILTIAPYIFIIGMIAIVSYGLNTLITATLKHVETNHEISETNENYQKAKLNFSQVSDQLSQQTNSPDNSNVYQNKTDELFTMIVNSYRNLVLSHDNYPGWMTFLFACLTFLIIVLSWRVDITEFSLHRLYENRLTRCYLGASNEERVPQPFTGFSRYDDIPLHDLVHNDGNTQAIGPYHLINTAINLVSGADLAWQERKAASFFLSPLYCGFIPPSNGSRLSKRSPEISKHGFRPTCQFACNKPGTHQTTNHCFTLGDAMTTSGAAASPNMGSQTSKVYSILLTIFNIRLGRWTGNPRHNVTYKKSGPAISLQLLISEVFGLTRSDTKYVYLSDGGHFENLGIYELVRRQCRYIIAIDAGADPEFKFDDLGNAIRKCRNDFGVSIDIDVSKIRERDTDHFNNWPCAIGCIHYSDTQAGTLLYIKSSLLRDAPEDVLNYAAQNSTFPHQTTGDQFFTESQFESYRSLGYHIGMKVLRDARFSNRENTLDTV